MMVLHTRDVERRDLRFNCIYIANELKDKLAGFLVISELEDDQFITELELRLLP